MIGQRRSGMLLALTVATAIGRGAAAATEFPIVDTGQSGCYDNAGFEIECPGPGESSFGQDAQHVRNQPAYRDNGDAPVLIRRATGRRTSASGGSGKNRIRHRAVTNRCRASGTRRACTGKPDTGETAPT